MNKGILSIHRVGQGLPIGNITGIVQGAQAILPVTLFVKNISILTNGAPADIATISVPFARWRCGGANTASALSSIVVESAEGSLTVTITAYDAPGGANGGGKQIFNGTGPSGGVDSMSGWVSTTPVSSTSRTIYIQQNSNSTNKGVCSFYVVIFPLP